MRRRLALTAALATLAPLAAVTGPLATPDAAHAAEADPSGNRIWAPTTATGELYGRRQKATVPLDVRFVAGDQPIELWSTRTAYDQPIRTVVRTPAGETALPAGSMRTFDGIGSMLAVTVVDARTGDLVRRASRDGCLGGYGQRARPDAPAHSPYPAPVDV